MRVGHINLILEDEPDGLVEQVHSTFMLYKKPEWFEDPLIKELLLGVDGTTVLFEEALKDNEGHGISPDRISNGCKSVIMMKYLPNRVYTNEKFGRNCWVYIEKLTKSGAVINIQPLRSIRHLRREGFDFTLFRINGESFETNEVIRRVTQFHSEFDARVMEEARREIYNE